MYSTRPPGKQFKVSLARHEQAGIPRRQSLWSHAGHVKTGRHVLPPNERPGGSQVGLLRPFHRREDIGRSKLEVEARGWDVVVVAAESPPLPCGLVLCMLPCACGNPQRTPPWRLPSRTCLGFFWFRVPCRAPPRRRHAPQQLAHTTSPKVQWLVPETGLFKGESSEPSAFTLLADNCGPPTEPQLTICT